MWNRKLCNKKFEWINKIDEKICKQEKKMSSKTQN